MATRMVEGSEGAGAYGRIAPVDGFPTASPRLGDGVVLFGTLEIPEGEAGDLTDAAVVRRLVANGVSRLSAERIVSIERSSEQPSRARRRAQSRP